MSAAKIEAWEVCNDHPDEETRKSLRYIRPVDRQFDSDEIAMLFGCDRQEQKDAANLIAAAPDLLHAIKAASDFDYRSQHGLSSRDVCALSAAAIAKATGSAS